MSDKDTIAALQRNLATADVERAMLLVAEVERLTNLLRVTMERTNTALLDARTVAERQRAACAEYLKHWTYDEHTLSRVRATPLVTEEEP